MSRSVSVGQFTKPERPAYLCLQDEVLGEALLFVKEDIFSRFRSHRRPTL